MAKVQAKLSVKLEAAAAVLMNVWSLSRVNVVPTTVIQMKHLKAFSCNTCEKKQLSAERTIAACLRRENITPYVPKYKMYSFCHEN
jgi:hypothetical protein